MRGKSDEACVHLSGLSVVFLETFLDRQSLLLCLFLGLGHKSTKRWSYVPDIRRRSSCLDYSSTLYVYSLPSPHFSLTGQLHTPTPAAGSIPALSSAGAAGPSSSRHGRKAPGGIGGAPVLAPAVAVGTPPSKIPLGRAPNTRPVNLLLSQAAGEGARVTSRAVLSVLVQRREHRIVGYLVRWNTAAQQHISLIYFLVFYQPVHTTLRVASDVIARAQPLTWRPSSPGARKPNRRCPRFECAPSLLLILCWRQTGGGITRGWFLGCMPCSLSRPSRDRSARPTHVLVLGPLALALRYGCTGREACLASPSRLVSKGVCQMSDGCPILPAGALSRLALGPIGRCPHWIFAYRARSCLATLLPILLYASVPAASLDFLLLLDRHANKCAALGQCVDVLSVKKN